MTLSFNDLGPRLTKEDILKQVSEEAIYKRFCKEFPSKLFHSPFRADKNPSFGFFKQKGRWLWKDMGGNGDHGDVFDFVARDQKTDFKGAIDLIANLFHIATNTTQVVVGRRFNEQIADEANQRSRKLIQVIRRDITSSEYEWWNRILWTPGLMEFYYVRAAKEVWVDKKLYWYNKDNNPIYYYLSPLTKNVKCYRPLEMDKKKRWLSNQDPHRDIQGYHQCNITVNKGMPLLLVKSMKEVGFFRAFGFNAMANTSEHTHFLPDFIRHIRKYCGPILYLGDNDWPGMRATLKVYQRYQIPGTIIPRKWGAKDPTDLWLANYRKVYDLLNFIYAYFNDIRIAGSGANPTRRLYYSGKEGQKITPTGGL